LDLFILFLNLLASLNLLYNLPAYHLQTWLADLRTEDTLSYVQSISY